MIQWNYYLAWNNQLLEMEYEEQTLIYKKHIIQVYEKIMPLIYSTYNNDIHYLLNEFSQLNNIYIDINQYTFIHYIQIGLNRNYSKTYTNMRVLLLLFKKLHVDFLFIM